MQALLCVLVAILQVCIPVQGICILGSDEDQNLLRELLGSPLGLSPTLAIVEEVPPIFC
jgi:hypothetical protein